MTTIPSRGAVALACLFAGLPAAQAASYHLVDLGESSQVYAINAKGEVAGAIPGSSPDGVAAIYANGGWTTKGDATHRSVAYGIDRAGNAVGEKWGGQKNTTLMYYPRGKQDVAIPLPNGALYGESLYGEYLSPGGISPDGTTVVGTFIDPLSSGTDQCFTWTPGAATSTALAIPAPYVGCQAYGVNDAGEIVGSLRNVENGVPFVYSGGVFTTFPQEQAGVLLAVNAKGHASGTSAINDEAMQWNGKTLRDIGARRGAVIMKTGNAINDHDDVVGSGFSFPNYTMVLRTGGQVVDLVPLIDDTTGWNFSDWGTPTGINDDGTILGWGAKDDGAGHWVPHAFLLTPIVVK